MKTIRWIAMIFLLALASWTVACGAGGDQNTDTDGGYQPSDGTSGTDGTTVTDDGPGDVPECETVQDCPTHQDCRCGDGSVAAGRTCEENECLDRREQCTLLCAGYNGWIPNPEGCWWWEIHGSDGIGENYGPRTNGCLSGLYIWVWRPDNLAGFAWCVPEEQCSADADCPTAEESVLEGIPWYCQAPVTSNVSFNDLRLCMPEDDVLCDQW